MSKTKPRQKASKNVIEGDQVFMLGDHIWIEPVSRREFDVALGARVIARPEGTRIQVIDDDGQEQWLSPERRIKTMHPTSIRGVEDMIALGDLNEAGILRNLLIRYNGDKIYTYTGSILVAVNPYQIIPSLYSPETMKMYRDKKIGELSPHVFAIGDNCFNIMQRTRQNQCVVISGESGAGKTESTKLILQYLAAISNKHSEIELKILQTNPILEAFGNAKTVRNDNSSRFGKFIEIYFDEDGSIEGARIDQYLLEKSRIVAQNKYERNYHIFYCMLAGLSKDHKDKLHLKDASNYKYLIGGKVIACDGRDDAAEFAEIRGAMKVLEMTDQDIWDVLKILASILHMGNVSYKAEDANEAANIPDQNNVERAAFFLGVNKLDFVRALTNKTIRVHGETVTSGITTTQSRDVRDAFAKGIYGRLFLHIVKKVNTAIFKTEISGNKSAIGILDIFGFENFEHNSFEQMCINYANENLQQFFVKHIFKMEQEEYTKEGINWEKISFIDNQATLNMIAQKPMNIISLIDEQTKFPKATDITLAQRLHQQHGTNEDYIKPKSDTIPTFGIRHFAGVVYYDTRGFLEKNRDTASNDILMLLPSSKNKFLQYLFNQDLKDLGDDSNKKKVVTLASQFKKSLDLLMATLGQCNPFFVRCVKPNEFKKPKIFDRELCCRQLRYSGMLETIRIRRAGYPVRFTFKEFVDRYRFLVTGIHKADNKTGSAIICEEILNNRDYQLGHSKVFLKDEHQLFLEQERDKALTKKILIIQKHIKGWYYRRQFLRQRKAAITIQNCWRSYTAKRSYLVISRGLKRLQAMLRSRALTNRYSLLKSVIVRFQARCRGYYVRRLEKNDEENSRETREERERMGVAEKKRTDEPIDDSMIVDDVFGYLDSEDDNDVKRDPSAFKDLPKKKRKKSETLMKIPAAPDYNEDTSEYSFPKFAKTFFQGNITHQYSRRMIKHSLLNLTTNGDKAAAMALWKCILRFMGDLPEPKHYMGDKDYTPMMSKVSATLGRNFSKTQQFQELSNLQQNGINGVQESVDKKLVSLTLKRQDKMGQDIKQRLLDDEGAEDSYSTWLDARPTSNMEKLHFITGHGILRPELRDEIFCQICKQLTNNPSKSSHARGWILLSLCVGCFGPSERFEKYLYQFIRRGPPGYAPFCDERLRRTGMNGVRTQPPSWRELQTTKTKQPITLQVTFMDGSSRSLLADSASTAKELCSQLSEKIGLKDQFGFSLFIALYDKVSSLGGGADHVMDAVSQCEQYAKEKGIQEAKAPWRLFFRKEIFSPWHDVMEDVKSTKLIYQQIVRGIKHGEYRCDKLDDLAMLMAQQYYVEQGSDQVSLNKLEELLPGYVVTVDKPLEYWQQMITQASKKSYYMKEQAANIKVQEDVVNFARFKWPLLFSRFYEAVRTAGPKLPKDEVIIAVNWTGIYMVDDQEQVILELSYPEIKSVEAKKFEKIFQNYVIISTTRNEEFTFTCTNSEDIKDVVEFFLEGLKKRSKYAVCTKPYQSVLKKGDLVKFGQESTGESLQRTMWCFGTNEKTKKEGDFPLDSLYILPTLSKPSNEILVPFIKSEVENRNYETITKKTGSKENVHTLEKFASTNFREMNQTSGTVSGRQRTLLSSATKTETEKLWRHSRDPLRLPLLRSLLDRDKEELAQEAVLIFTAILKYMGDLPSRALRASNELTDQIFLKPLKHEILRDEVYCQIMKQLTFNKNPHSEQRGWDLLWLATGMFPCSKNLFKDLTLFQKTRKNPISADTILRLERTLKQGQRKCPPHQVEVEAIQHKTPEIYHKIYFPDNTEEVFLVDSSIKAKDLVKAVVQKLNLVSSSGFSVFVKIADKVISVPENDFFFDFIRNLTDWIKKARPARDGTIPNYSYQVFFMRKLWLSVQPGKDRNADTIFHFPQELPKYLRGWHKIGINEAPYLAALVYRTYHGKSKDLLLSSPQVLNEILPFDLIKEQKHKDWVKQIEKVFNKQSKLDRDDAKIEFLKETFKLPTFGSTFFEVKQTTDQNYPELVLVAINKNGVNLIHRQSKEILVTFPFSKISNWSSGNTYFHLTIGNLVRGSKLLCETALGYKMDDLLTSYTFSIVENINKQRTVRGKQAKQREEVRF